MYFKRRYNEATLIGVFLYIHLTTLQQPFLQDAPLQYAKQMAYQGLKKYYM